MDILDFNLWFSTKAMIIFFVAVVIISITATLLIRPQDYAKTRFHVFMSILASISVLLIGLSLVISSLTLEGQQEANLTVTEQAIAKLWAVPNELIVRSQNARNKFIKSLYYNNPDLFKLSPREEPETRFSILEEQNIAMMLLQAWEDFLSYKKIIKTSSVPWLCTFIQWAQSPYLKNYFMRYKYFFKDATIEFGNMLFHYASKLPVPTINTEDYPALVSTMLKDPKLIKIFEAHSN